MIIRVFSPHTRNGNKRQHQRQLRQQQQLLNERVPNKGKEGKVYKKKSVHSRRSVAPNINKKAIEA